MPNLLHYVQSQAPQTLLESPFSAPDSLALTQIVYMPMEGLPDGVTVRDLRDHLDSEYPDGFTDPFQRKRLRFTRACADSRRFANLTIHGYVNHVDPRQETQFCACVFALPDGGRYVAFRGTDLSIAGWKEDLNMSFMAVPAQQEAVDYVCAAAAGFAGPLRLGGHSKGGHLALYAAAHADAGTQARIVNVCSFDGPGMDEATLHGEGYGRIRDRVRSYIPQSSVVGMLLCYHPVYTVVRSLSIGLLQHDALTWQVKDGTFETLQGLDLGTRLADEALRQWIDKLSLSERRMLTDTAFRLISALDSETVDPLVQELPASSMKLIAAFRRLEPETRAEMHRLLSDLFSSGASEAVRALLPASLRRIGDVPSASQWVETIKDRQEEFWERLWPKKPEERKSDGATPSQST